jgi:hypothetical protein
VPVGSSAQSGRSGTVPLSAGRARVSLVFRRRLAHTTVSVTLNAPPAVFALPSRPPVAVAFVL